MSKKPVIRIGDYVTLEKPTPQVLRVGYRLHWTEVDLRQYPDLQAIADAARKVMSMRNHQSLCAALAKEVVKREKFGGRERVVVRDDEAECLPPGSYLVTGKKRKILGTYEPVWFTPDSALGPEQYEPAYIRNQRVIHILEVVKAAANMVFPLMGQIVDTDCAEMEVSA